MTRSRRLAAVVVAAGIGTALAVGSSAAQPTITTEFEDSGGTTWTSRQGEWDFLESVDAASGRVEVVEVGTTAEGTPMHLVSIGHPEPVAVADAGELPVELHVCTQHGNEPAGREACLIAIRDLAFTDDPVLVAQLASQVTLFVPTGNPDGREANTRENTAGADLNRQHLAVDHDEVRHIGRIMRDWQPEITVDHHEYSGVPVTYDDDLTILWPRNKNVHRPLRDLARDYVVDWMKPCAADAGFTMDEYGIQSVSVLATDIDLVQTAGDHDDGISRNAAGLRHSLGILIESNALGAMRDRVDAHLATIDCTLAWMRDNAEQASAVADSSRAAKVAEGRDRTEPTWFDGQDEDTTVEGLVVGSRTESTSFQDPPFCGFVLTADQLTDEVEIAFEVHGITARPLEGGATFVSMAQEAEPVIGLLLDERGFRHLVAASGLDDCSDLVFADEQPGPGDDGSEETPTTGGGVALAAVGVVAMMAAVGRRRSLVESSHGDR